jgi:hypothetical protein
MLQSDRDAVKYGAMILIFADSSHSWICLSAPAVESQCQVRSRACRPSVQPYECRSPYMPKFTSLLKIEIARDIRPSRDRKKERLLRDKGVRAQIVKRCLALNYRVITILIDERGTLLCGLQAAAAPRRLSRFAILVAAPLISFFDANPCPSGSSARSPKALCRVQSYAARASISSFVKVGLAGPSGRTRNLRWPNGMVTIC